MGSPLPGTKPDQRGDTVKAKTLELWRCEGCDEIHEWEDEARECCAPEITELYGCIECDKVHDDKAEAIDCCNALTAVQCPSCLRDHGSQTINATAVRVTGHCSVCNPLYSTEQVFQVEDVHMTTTNQRGDLLRGASSI